MHNVPLSGLVEGPPKTSGWIPPSGLRTVGPEATGGYYLGPPVTDAGRGKMLFNDATLSFQGRLSCATCHPDGRSDGLFGDLTNDGIGNTKNAKSLLFSHETPPVTATGLFPSLDACVPFEVKTILFSGAPRARREGHRGLPPRRSGRSSATRSFSSGRVDGFRPLFPDRFGPFAQDLDPAEGRRFRPALRRELDPQIAGARDLSDLHQAGPFGRDRVLELHQDSVPLDSE